MNNLPYRHSYRLKTFDYSNAGYYYATICTGRRLSYFGEVVNGEVKLSEHGMVAKKFWEEIPEHYSLVNLDEFIIMPNHIHGIVVINQRPADDRPYKALNLSKIIGSYKNFVSKIIHKLGNPGFEWQHSFYDNIIRSEKALNEIREYIVNNPKQWELDKDNPKNWK